MQNPEADYYRDLETAFGACMNEPTEYCVTCGDVDVLAVGEVCPDCRRDAQEVADAAQIEQPPYRVMKMTAKGGFVRGWGGQWWKVRS